MANHARRPASCKAHRCQVYQDFDRAAVTYGNRSKMEQRCQAGTLEKYGAVSEETAVEMAVGIRNVSGTDIGISVTGIAGPGGATDEKPIGLVYTALAHRDGVTAKKLHLWGNRAKIRNMACLHVFDMIRRYLTRPEDFN